MMHYILNKSFDGFLFQTVTKQYSPNYPSYIKNTKQRARNTSVTYKMKNN